MPTLKQLRADSHEKAAALRAAEDRLGQARDRMRAAIAAAADLEQSALTEDVDSGELQRARDEKTAAQAALDAVTTELKPRA